MSAKDFVRTSGHFDVDAVMQKWGFGNVPADYYISECRQWIGMLDGRLVGVPDASARNFATLLLMRN